ncbi:MAG: hypothetical protein H6719_36570 [Sandaracinaceae bacterium]|nr:hypothetical protein [Sandaracinaceae bacterium]
MPPPAQPQKKSGGVVALVVVISLCVVSVPCVGVLSAIAIPAFIGYLTNAKTSEARANLVSMVHGAEAYYATESFGQGGVANTNCAVGDGRTTNVPGPAKTALGPLGEPFDSIGFALADPVYYQYEIVGVGGCGHTEGEPLYSFRAYGDLDGDGTTSLYEISVAAGPDGTLTRSPAIYTENELE